LLVDPRESERYRRVIAWEQADVDPIGLSSPYQDSVSTLADRLKESEVAVAYLFLTTCPTCRSIKPTVADELARFPRQTIFTISTEPDSVVRGYWDSEKSFPLLTVSGELPAVFGFAPVVACLEHGVVRRAYLGDVRVALRELRERLLTSSRCPDLPH
jgi:hypothetical protein